MSTIASPDGLAERAPIPDDAPSVLDLIHACDIADVGAPDYTLADLRSDWAYPRFDLSRDARLLIDDDRRVRAYIAVRQYETGRRFWGDLYVHPEVRGSGAERWAIAVAEELAAALADAPDASLFLYADEGSPLAELFAGLGYTDVRRMWRMEIELDGAPPGSPDLPPGLEVRPFETSQARAVHAAVQEAFADEWGHVPEPFEEWASRKLDHEEFDPANWWVAWDGDQVAGCVFANVGEGVDVAWISTVGVRSPWRGRGLALGLLRRAFSDLAGRGMPRVALGVDSENPTGATRLYERAGMRIAKCWVRFDRPVSEFAR